MVYLISKSIFYLSAMKVGRLNYTATNAIYLIASLLRRLIIKLEEAGVRQMVSHNTS